MRHFIVLICSLFVLACNSDFDTFYARNKKEDLYILPLVKPYFLYSPIPGKSLWHLDFQTEVKDQFGAVDWTNVCEINVVDSVIFGHCVYREGSPNDYFAIVIREKIEIIFPSKEGWESFLKSKNISNFKTFDVLSTYSEFKNDYKSLPWMKGTFQTN